VSWPDELLAAIRAALARPGRTAIIVPRPAMAELGRSAIQRMASDRSQDISFHVEYPAGDPVIYVEPEGEPRFAVPKLAAEQARQDMDEAIRRGRAVS
jgi:hypothetical protein